VRVVVISVGRLRAPYADDVAHYSKLLARHVRLEQIELREASPALAAAASPSPALSPLPAANQPAANVPTAAPSLVENVKALTSEGNPLPYTAAWHHRHLYNPRSITEDSLMPSYRFLYTKRRISGEGSPDALNFAGDADETPATGWEIVPSYDAKCLVAYLMSRDQSHSLKEAKSPIVAAAPPPAPEAKK